jgi:P pilus assembly chaperone PapD
VGIADMRIWTTSVLAASLCAASFIALPSVASAGVGDLLVAPTRVVLDGRKGAEVILNNIGDEPATYRVSVEFRRMTENGDLVGVTSPTDADKEAEEMIVYAPRKVVLAPHEPQAIRIAARAPEGLPDGEYRVHILFRAIPPATPVVAPSGEQPKGVQFKLTPVYGVTIPVIVRLGNLQATAAIANVQLERKGRSSAQRQFMPVTDPLHPNVTPFAEPQLYVGLDILRQGSRSTFGEVRVTKAGVKQPIADIRGIAVYTEVGKRHVSVPVPASFTGAANGPVTVEYIETYDDGSHLLAQTQAVLR